MVAVRAAGAGFILRAMRRSTAVRIAVLLASVTAAGPLTAADMPDWSRFRGPNGSGISTATRVPVEFGPGKNLLWRLDLPQGHSSPILLGNRIYLTGFRGDTLVTLAIDRETGALLWEGLRRRSRRERSTSATTPPRRARLSKRTASTCSSRTTAWSPTMPQAPSCGRWPLARSRNIYGMGSSPIIVGDMLVLACDQSLGFLRDGARQAHGKDPLEGRAARSEERPFDAYPLEGT